MRTAVFRKAIGRRRKSCRQGFSLIEVVIAIFIITVMFAFYQAALRSTALARSAKYKDLALRIANNKMEELRAGGYGSLPASSPFSDPLLSSLPSGSAAMSISDYNDKTKQVSAIVSWKELAGSESHSVSLSTLITQVGGIQ